MPQSGMDETESDGLLDWELPDELKPPKTDELGSGINPRAVELVRTYFARGNSPSATTSAAPEPAPDYTGAEFNTLGGVGDAEAVRDELTAEDLLSLSLLSITIDPKSVLALFGDGSGPLRARISELLSELPTTVDLVDADDGLLEGPATELWALLRTIPGLGIVSVNKLLARKRPRLLPVIDSVVCETLSHGNDGNFWKRLRAQLQRRDGDDALRLHDRLLAIGAAAGVPEGTSAIRIFDVIVWMVGKERNVGKKPRQSQ